MRRLLPLLLALLLPTLLVMGCDLRNRQDSADLIPTGPYQTVNPNGSGYAGTPAVSGNTPIFPSEQSAVKTVLSYSGQIPLTRPPRTYSYQLPLIDLPGAHAAGCNQDIEDFFGTLIRQSLEAMERSEEPLLERLSYTSYTIEGILTLRVDRRDSDGSDSQAWYTVDAETGGEVSVSRLFAAAGIEGKPETVINEAVTARFAQRCGQSAASDPDTAYRTALLRTQEGLSPLTPNRMHLNENGSLTVAFELFSPKGGSSIDQLVLP